MEARHYRRLADGRANCHLCPHECVIAEGRTGFCKVRRNDGGTLTATTYGLAAAVAMDPIEKKPLYHFHPGQNILSIGSWGCNLKCRFCQNWSISQQRAASEYLAPDQAVQIARRQRSSGIAYTYNEPLISFEYVRDTGALAHDAGLTNVLVTNGFIHPEPLAQLLPLVDGLNLDIKSIRDDFYHKLCGAKLQPVLDTAVAARQVAHVEVTNLVIPGYNDSPDDLTGLADWIARHLGRDTPVHLSAHFPRYKLGADPTSPAILNMAYEIFAQRLDFVYLGNTLSDRGSHTCCRSCGRTLVERQGYSVRVVGLTGSTCSHCGAEIYMIV